MIKKILPKIKEKICNYQKDKKQFEDLIQSKEKKITFFSNLNKKLNSLDDQSYEPFIDVEKLKEYLIKTTENSTLEEIDLNKIRSNLGVLVSKNIDWTMKKDCKLSTLLYLKQNNY